MPKTAKKKPKLAKRTKGDLANLELDAGAWPRFEALVKSAAKMGHKPHKKPRAKRAGK